MERAAHGNVADDDAASPVGWPMRGGADGEQVLTGGVCEVSACSATRARDSRHQGGHHTRKQKKVPSCQLSTERSTNLFLDSSYSHTPSYYTG